MSGLRPTVDAAELGFADEGLEDLDARLRAYVDDGRLPGWLLSVSRHGRPAHLAMHGLRDVEAGAPVQHDTIWRIYSMTKPITAVTALALWERGAFELTDPVQRFIPAFAEQRVWRGGSALRPDTDPVIEPMQVWHLLTHTSGLTYGFLHAHPVDAMYRAAGFEWGIPEGMDLAGVCDRLAGLPLLFQPGAEWNYGVSSEVLGRVIEVVADRPLQQVMRDLVLDPLGMVDTDWWVPEDKQDRLAALYVPSPESGGIARFDQMGADALSEPSAPLGGGGLCATAEDFRRFAEMLRGGGELEGVRILAPGTVRTMTSNQLPGNVDLSTYGRRLFAETTFDGIGYGLGVSVTLDPMAGRVPGSVGDHGWGGGASTFYWVDPVLDLVVVFMTQLLPSSAYPIRSLLKQMVHAALVGPGR